MVAAASAAEQCTSTSKLKAGFRTVEKREPFFVSAFFWNIFDPKSKAVAVGAAAAVVVVSWTIVEEERKKEY